MPSPSASDNTKQAKQTRHPPTPHDSFDTGNQSKKGKETNITKITEDQRKKIKNRKKTSHSKTTFKPAAPVGGTSSIVMFYFLVGLVPCYPVCNTINSWLLVRQLLSQSEKTPSVPTLSVFLGRGRTSINSQHRLTLFRRTERAQRAR